MHIPDCTVMHFLTIVPKLNHSQICMFTPGNRSPLQTPVQTPHVQKGRVRWLVKVMSASVQQVGMEVIVNTVSKHTGFYP